MRLVPSLTLLPLALLTMGCGDEILWPVRATIDDGQVLMGSIRTPVLLLDGGLGTLSIPWDDVGEVLPVEGDELGSSGGFVDVWLRNGSELTGQWVDAELSMDLSVGGDQLAVDVPVEQLLRLQTQGGELWPQGVVYRVRTSHGDDFLVDPEASRLVMDNAMGTFAPFLSECASAAPIDDPTGDWRIELITGTVLIGPLVDEAITFQLGLGPDEATVPLDKLVSLERQDWGGYGYPEESTGMTDRILSAIPKPALHRTPTAAAPVETWDPVYDMDSTVQGELATMDAEHLAEAAQPLEVDGRFGDTGAGGLAAQGDFTGPTAGPALSRSANTTGSTAGAVRGQRPTDGWFDNARLRDAKQAMH